MRDVRIVHDRVGAYADWEWEQGDTQRGMELHRYLLGQNKPRYPMPATLTNAAWAQFMDNDLIFLWEISFV